MSKWAPSYVNYQVIMAWTFKRLLKFLSLNGGSTNRREGAQAPMNMFLISLKKLPLAKILLGYLLHQLVSQDFWTMKTVGLDLGTLKTFVTKRGPTGFNLIFLSMADFPRALSWAKGDFERNFSFYENFPVEKIPHLLSGLLTTNLPICRISKMAHSSKL